MLFKVICLILLSSLSLVENKDAKKNDLCNCYHKFFPQPHGFINSVVHLFKPVDVGEGLKCLGYNKKEVSHPPVIIGTDIKILQVNSIDPMRKRISIAKHVSALWSDDRLIWSKECSKNGWVNFYDQWDDIWIPKIYSRSQSYGTKTEYHEGKLVWNLVIFMDILPCITKLLLSFQESGIISMYFKSLEYHDCKFEVHWYPFDEVLCHIDLTIGNLRMIL